MLIKTSINIYFWLSLEEEILIHDFCNYYEDGSKHVDF